MRQIVLQKRQLTSNVLLGSLKAAAEVTRLRILALLARGELTVKDLTAILGQSQPRISRHLKLLVEAGLVERLPEGAWAYYRLSDDDTVGAFIRGILCQIDDSDPVIAGDSQRLDGVKQEHAEAAARYFSANAGEWDRIRLLQAADAAVEKAMREAVGNRPFEAFLDIGTGTGRMLELFSDLYNRGIGIDANHSMLAVARANLEKAGVRDAQVRHGDLYALPLPSDSVDLVVIHQVLHYLGDPARALREAARVLAPGGRLLVVDFAPHDLEFLRTEHAHLRLGFSHDQIAQACAAAGLETEAIRDLAPATAASGTGDGNLTVTLWLARDPRILMADDGVGANLETVG
ncbi:ArsR family transcriptional regulator [Rhodobium orientis]|uniref:ArsR/SmtB family transcription factor n=1 Tax=Rhodobium orientis TaxID=34017 RepID=UPI0017DF7B7D|nr:ArsR family transcriptional regulator [Rhodobium orientis]